jgi:MFS family permease
MVAVTNTQTNTAAPTNAEKIRLLYWHYIRDAMNTVYVHFTFFGSAFILFLNELGMTNSEIGFLLSLAPFLGVLSMFFASSVGRFGYKKTWLTFFGLRKLMTFLLVLVPWVASRNSHQFTLYFIGAIVALVALCRAISETAIFPWMQEIIPNSIRGRFTAIANIVVNIVGLIAVTVASWVIEHGTGYSRFTVLFALGAIFGLLSVWASSFHPGGASTRGTANENIPLKSLLQPLRDRNFMIFIAGISMITLATVPMFSFQPLFMRDQIGLSDANVVMLVNGTLLGALSATYLAGWAADRYGSKPVMQTGVWMMMLMPVCWLFMPRLTAISLPIAIGIAFLQGIATIMWAIGSSRMLFVNVVPPDQKAQYMGVYYTLASLIAGISQLVGGWMLDLFEGLSGQFATIVIDAFTPLFIGGFLLLIVAMIMFHFIRTESSIRTTEFAGMFLHGNPLLAFQSMIRYYRAKDEHETIVVTEKLGQAHSRLTVDELLEALHDPRFFVRFEAVVSIARSDPDPRYVEALTQILQGTELSLTVMAAWALGRIGDARAIEALRGGLNSEYRSIRAHCSRALGALDDTSIAPDLLERLQAETDIGLQMAYAAALGSLKAPQAIHPIIALMHTVENEGARMELALALARIAGNEQQFIRLWRDIRSDAGTTAAQEVFALGRKFASLRSEKPEFDTLILTATDYCGHDDLAHGLHYLADIIAMLPEDATSAEARTILEECAAQLRVHGASRIEYLVLAFDLLGTV